MLNIFKKITTRKEPYDPKYATAVKYGYDTRCIVVDLIDTDENRDILQAALESIEREVPALGNVWCQNYDGYLDEGDEDRLQIVVCSPNAILFKMHIMSILRLLSAQTGKDLKLYQSKGEWDNTRGYYDYYGYISEMK